MPPPAWSANPGPSSCRGSGARLATVGSGPGCTSSYWLAAAGATPRGLGEASARGAPAAAGGAVPVPVPVPVPAPAPLRSAGGVPVGAGATGAALAGGVPVGPGVPAGADGDTGTATGVIVGAPPVCDGIGAGLGAPASAPDTDARGGGVAGTGVVAAGAGAPASPGFAAVAPPAGNSLSNGSTSVMLFFTALTVSAETGASRNRGGSSGPPAAGGGVAGGGCAIAPPCTAPISNTPSAIRVALVPTAAPLSRIAPCSSTRRANADAPPLLGPPVPHASGSGRRFRRGNASTRHAQGPGPARTRPSARSRRARMPSERIPISAIATSSVMPAARWPWT